MILPIRPKQTRQQRRKAEREKDKGSINVQAIVNKLMYKILMENKGTLQFPATDLDDVPQPCSFMVEVQGGQMRVTAGSIEPVKKSPLILPGKEIIPG